LKAIEILKKNFGEEHVQYASTLGNLSNILVTLGDYQGAKDGLLKALEIKKKNFGEEHVDYASTLGNLSNTLYKLGDY
jgi:tetratricopeptide (TPR) repeat protein